MFIYSKSTPHNQEFILEYECDHILVEVFLDKVNRLWGEDQGTKIVVLRKVQPIDLDHTLVAVTGTSSQKLISLYSRHVIAVICPIPGRPWSSCPTEYWVSRSEQVSATDHVMEGQDTGLEHSVLTALCRGPQSLSAYFCASSWTEEF